MVSRRVGGGGRNRVEVKRGAGAASSRGNARVWTERETLTNKIMIIVTIKTRIASSKRPKWHIVMNRISMI